MFTTGEAAAVALGLMAAQRLGLEAGGALAKVRRVLPETMRRGVEALEVTLGFTEAIEAAPPDGETLLALADAARRGRRVRARYTDSAGADSERELSPHGVVAHSGRWYVAGFDHSRGELRALRADRAAVRVGGRGEPAPDGLRRGRVREPDARAGAVGARGRGAAHVDLEAAARTFPPTLAELEARDGGTLLRLRADSLDWAAGLLAGAGCGFTILGPEALRERVHAWGAMVTAPPLPGPTRQARAARFARAAACHRPRE